jgi:hypothetical protein
MTDWRGLTADAALASHRLVGWIYWDPTAVAGYAALGVPDGTGYYIATRAASIADAGDDVVTAVFGSIHPAFVSVCLDLCRQHTTFEAAAEARDAAVEPGLREIAPDLCAGLAELGPDLWAAADQLVRTGRPLFASLLRRRREDQPLLSAWLAVNCIREWRGDTHWAIHAAEGIDGTMAGLLDAAWRGHDDDWLPRSRAVPTTPCSMRRSPSWRTAAWPPTVGSTRRGSPTASSSRIVWTTCARPAGRPSARRGPDSWSSWCSPTRRRSSSASTRPPAPGGCRRPGTGRRGRERAGISDRRRGAGPARGGVGAPGRLRRAGALGP